MAGAESGRSASSTGRAVGLTPALSRAIAHADAWLAGLDDAHVAATAGLDELRAKLGGDLQSAGLPPEQVIDELAAGMAGGLIASGSGRFFAWVIGGVLPSALAADWLVSAWDQNGALHATSPAAGVVEEVAGAWLLDVLDLPRDASFAFTTGCQMAHVTALAAARHAVLRDAGWDVERDGLSGAPRVRIIVTDQRHASIDKAVRLLGMGSGNLVELAVDDEGRVGVDVLRAALAAGVTPTTPSPTIVVLDAADLNVAAFDPFDELVPLAKEAGAWVHVDGAFGLFARASRSKRHLTAGVERADSWATDGHKWLNVPFDCGFVAVRDAAAHHGAMSVSASYIAPGGEARDEIDWNPEWSKRSRGVVAYAALRELGRDGLEALVDDCCDRARDLVAGMGELDGCEVLWLPDLNQGLVRFLDLRDGATDADHDARTVAVIEAVNATGEAFFSGTRWRGKQAMRVSVVNWRTDSDAVARSVAAVERVLGGG